MVVLRRPPSPLDTQLGLGAPNLGRLESPTGKSHDVRSSPDILDAASAAHSYRNALWD